MKFYSRAWKKFFSVLVLVAPIACTGVIGSDGSEPRAGTGTPGKADTPGGGTPGTGAPGSPRTPGGTNMPGAAADPNAAGQMPLRRLTRREYNNTVFHLLGDTSGVGNQFPVEGGAGFTFERSGSVATQDALLIRGAAEALAEKARASLGTLVSCDPATGDDACARKFIESFGLRAYRRPLVPAEAERLMAHFSMGRTALKLSFADGIVFLIETMLQTPEFLYHWQTPTGPVAREGSLVRLGAYDIASRLSYFIIGSMPDPELFAAAAANKLSTAAEVEAQARRLVATSAAGETLSVFFEDWLHLRGLTELSKDAKVYPDFNAGIAKAMKDELRSFVQFVVFEDGGRWESLLTAPYSLINQNLGAVYDLPAVRGMDMQKVTLNPTQRRGFLTQAAFLTLNGASDGSHPVKRGHALFEKLLCGTLPPPPADVPPPKEASTGGTTRQRFAEHADMPCASACHALMDPLGFAFENYDGIGKYRTIDNGLPVDASGSIELDGKAVPFANALELSSALGRSAEVRRCLATQWMRFALLRTETDEDRASIDGALKGFLAKNGDIRELMVGVATSRSFRYRAPAPGEVLQ